MLGLWSFSMMPFSDRGPMEAVHPLDSSLEVGSVSVLSRLCCASSFCVLLDTSTSLGADSVAGPEPTRWRMSSNGTRSRWEEP